ncbi:hypothetical protein V6N13_065380 [Hibiscus sabdariffa]
MAMESKETVYFNEEAECARAAVKEVLDRASDAQLENIGITSTLIIEQGSQHVSLSLIIPFLHPFSHELSFHLHGSDFEVGCLGATSTMLSLQNLNPVAAAQGRTGFQLKLLTVFRASDSDAQLENFSITSTLLIEKGFHRPSFLSFSGFSIQVGSLGSM